MSDLEYIDRYLKKELSFNEIKEFEKRIEDDEPFAEEFAFYVSSISVIKSQSAQEKKKRFKEIYSANTFQSRSIIKKLWPYIAAAAILACVVLGLYLYQRPVSPSVLADKYISEELQQLPVKMGNREDSMKTGILLYNHGELPASLNIFENIVQADKFNTDAKYYAGIVSLQMQDYDNALKYFTQLQNYPGLQINPGKFYCAITLMKRNQPGDKELAKQLLIEVDSNNLTGKNKAKEWLRKF